MIAATRLACTLALMLTACSDGAAGALLAREATATASDPDDGWWRAVRRLELDAARTIDGTGERGAFLDALASALEGGSEAAERELCALAASTRDPTLRRAAGQAALNLLRIEARWGAMADFGARCGLALGEGAIPDALLRLPAVTLELSDEPVVLPLREVGRGLPLVAARVRGPAGAEDVLALIDTGAGLCMVASDAAERLGVTPLGDDPLTVIGSAGGRVASRPASLPELRLGGLVARDVPVVILDAETLEALLPDVPFVVGWELLQRLVVEFGGAAGELVLRRPDAPADDAPRNLVLLHEPLVRARAAGHELLLLLDTGATGSDLTPPCVARLGLTGMSETRDHSQGLGARLEAVVPVVPQLDLQLGDAALALQGIPVWELPHEAQRLVVPDGTLAADVALIGRLIVDGPARRVSVRAR